MIKNAKINSKFCLDKSRSIRDQIYSLIKQLILDEEFSSDTRITESQLAQKFNISRTPVREALHNLERDGLLKSIPRSGYQLNSMPMEEFEALCEMRIINETLAVKLAIKRMLPGFIDGLEDNLRLTNAEIKKGNIGAFVELDGEFHRLLQKGSGSDLILKYCEQLRSNMVLFRHRSLSDLETVLKAFDGHQAIVDCIRRCAENEVERVLREHINFAKGRYKQVSFS